MKDYLLGVVAMAFLVSLLNALAGEGAGQMTRKLVGGILLTLTVFRPLGNLELSMPDPESFRREAEAAAAVGVEQAETLWLQRITEQCSAYILNKAAAMGLDAQAEVTVGAQGLPEAVIIYAAATPSERQELTGILVRELGIEREAVEWIDPHQSSESIPS